MHDHIMIIGGTGMLKSASIMLARRCNLLTSIASTAESLDALNKEIAPFGTHHHLLPLNWDSHDFLNEISEYLQNQVCPTLIVAWIHRNSLGPELAVAMSQQCEKEITLFQVVGSAIADPSSNLNLSPTHFPSNLNFHRIILGFDIEKGNSRWLTNEEISAGVISTIDSNSETAIVGKVSPWSERPWVIILTSYTVEKLLADARIFPLCKALCFKRIKVPKSTGVSFNNHKVRKVNYYEAHPKT